MENQIVDFQVDVIAKSREVPVLVDFWAPWCGPCLALGPVLEKLALEAGSMWQLVKVNVDENREISKSYQVRGIPDVRLFYGGEVIGGFSGALTETMVRRWLEGHLPGPANKAIQVARAHLESGNRDLVIQELEATHRANPENQDLCAFFSRLILFDDPLRAIELASLVGRGSAHYESMQEIKLLAGLISRSADNFPEAPVKGKYLEAVEALKGQQMDLALGLFIEVIMANKKYDDEGARKACVAIFHHLGEAHPISRKHRKRFGMALD